MEVLRNAERPERRLRRPTVAIGTFDGVHLGHRRLFELAQEHSGGEREAAVLTFDPHPAKALCKDLAPLLITSTERKIELIGDAGIGTVIIQRFDRDLATVSHGEFVERILVRGLGVAEAIIGYDFSYGYKRGGTPETLMAAGRKHDFRVTVVPAITVSDIVCSSTRVRQFVLEGRLQAAALLLGRPVEIIGTVARGRGRGRSLGIPTANLDLEAELLPPVGVYAAWAAAAGGSRQRAVINIGCAPTFEQGGPLTVEAHLLDFSDDIYDRRLVLEVVHRLRGEQRFPSPDALVKQVNRDIERAREVLT